MNYVEAVDAAKRETVDEYSRQLKVLLETKHLYQKVSIDFDTIAAKFRKRIQPQEKPHVTYFNKATSEFANERFAPSPTLLTALQRGAPDHVVAT